MATKPRSIDSDAHSQTKYAASVYKSVYKYALQPVTKTIRLEEGEESSEEGAYQIQGS